MGEQLNIDKKLKRCSKCADILKVAVCGPELPENCPQCGHEDKSGKWYKEEAICVWYICGPDGRPRYMHRHPIDSINKLTRNKWKVFDTSARKNWRQDENLRVVE